MYDELIVKLNQLEKAQLEYSMSLNEIKTERRRYADKVEDKIDIIVNKQKEIDDKLNRLQGFTAGVAFTFSCLGALLGFIWDNITSH